MTEIVIYGSRLSPFVEKVCAVAEYKRLPFELSDIGFSKLPKLSRVTGKIPVASCDGEIVYDSTFIVRRLDALQPEPALLSEDPVVAAAQRRLEDWSDESLYWTIMALRWCDENEARTVEQMKPFLPAPARPLARTLLRRLIAKTPQVQGMGRLPYDVLIRETGATLDDLVLTLGRDAFFFGDRPCIADFAVYGMFCNGCGEATPDFAKLVSERPALADWMKRVEDTTRP